MNNDLTSLKVQFDSLSKKWKEEKEGINEAKEIKKELEKAKFDLGVKFSEGNYQEASKLQYQVIPSLESKLTSLTKEGSSDRLVNEIVDE